jgi:hypothetical protein
MYPPCIGGILPGKKRQVPCYHESEVFFETASLFFHRGSHADFAKTGLKLVILLTASQAAGILGVNHHA